MESICDVLCRACHRQCRHGCESRFRPYVRGELRRIVDEATSAFPAVIANLPADLTCLALAPE